MIKEPTKPVKPFKNFYTFLHDKYMPFEHKAPPYKCVGCEGRGLIYDPDDPPCPIEGNKMRHRIKCPKCNGSKRSIEADWKQVYKEHINRYKERLEVYKRNKALYDSIVRKLTEEELKYLGIK